MGFVFFQVWTWKAPSGWRKTRSWQMLGHGSKMDSQLMCDTPGQEPPRSMSPLPKVTWKPLSKHTICHVDTFFDLFTFYTLLCTSHQVAASRASLQFCSSGCCLSAAWTCRLWTLTAGHLSTLQRTGVRQTPVAFWPRSCATWRPAATR